MNIFTLQFKLVLYLLLFFLSACSDVSTGSNKDSSNSIADSLQLDSLVATKGQFYSLSISIIGIDTSDYSISIDESTPSSWLRVNNTQKTLSGVPTVNDVGSNNIKLLVNKGSTTEVQNITISVIDLEGLSSNLTDLIDDSDDTTDITDSINESVEGSVGISIVGNLKGTINDTKSNDTNLSTSGSLKFSDSSNTANAFIAGAITNKPYGRFSITANGFWTYVSKPLLNQLNESDSLFETYLVTAHSGAWQLVTINLKGSDDSANFTGDTTGIFYDSILDDEGKSISGVVQHTDVDTNNFDNVFIASDNLDNTYGVLKLSSGGDWTYTAKSALNQLNTLDNIFESFLIQTEDGSTVDLIINLKGENDAPHLVSDVDAISVNVNQTYSLDVKDPEGDSFSVVSDISSSTLFDIDFSEADKISFVPLGPTGVEKGVQFKLIDSKGNESIDYTLDVSVSGISLDEANTNVSLSSAQQIYQNSSISANIEPNSSDDWFKFIAFEAGSVELILSHSTDNDLRFFDIEIRNSDNEIVLNSFSLEDDKFLFPVTQAGSYFIKISPSDLFGELSRAYSLNLEYYSSSIYALSWTIPDKYEDDNILNVATDLVTYKVYYGENIGNINYPFLSIPVLIDGEVSTSVLLANLRPNQEYYFAMTSVSNEGIESILSSPVLFVPN